MNIYTNEGRIAYTALNLPGGDGKTPATDEQVKAHAERMNAKAEGMALKTRYEAK